MQLKQGVQLMLGVVAQAVAFPTFALDYMPNQVLVKFRDQTSVQAVAGVYSKQLLSDVTLYNHLGVEKWEVLGAQGVQETIEALRNDPAVEFVEPNYRRKAYVTSSNASDWYNQSAYSSLNVKLAWDAIVNAGNNTNIASPKTTVVAIFDTAVDIQNKALQPYLWTDNGSIKGYDAVDRDNDPSPGRCVDPDTGSVTTDPPHGTMVASVIAGLLEHIKKQTGAVPPIKILPVRLGCLFLESAELDAFDTLLNKDSNIFNVNIINASYGSVWYSGITRKALENLRDKDILFVAAAGNFDGNNDLMPNYPGDYDLPNIMSVGATEGLSPDKLTYWSHYGATSVDLAAPGDSVYVTGIRGLYQTEAGTSFASPMVAGVAALVMSATPNKNVAGATVRKVRAALQAGVSPLRDQGFLATDGRVDALGAVEYLKAPAPMIVVRSVKIDDTKGGGNRNHELDPGETASLVVELENFGETAFNLDVSATITNPQLSGFTLSASPAVLTSIPSGGTAKVVFSLSADANQTSYRRLPIKFTISSISPRYQISRHVPIEYGPLIARQSVEGSIYTAYGNAQDDTQIYHITLPAEFNYVKFSLGCSTPCDNRPGMLSLVARRGALPRFGWEEDSDGNFVLVRDAADVAGISAGHDVKVTAAGGYGTYYLAVAVNQEYSRFGAGANPLGYTLIAEPGYKAPPPKPRNFGCAMGNDSGGYDPVFFILLVVAVWIVARPRIHATRR